MTDSRNGPLLHSFAASIAQEGWAVTPAVIAPSEVEQLRADVATVAVSGRGGARNILDLPSVRQLAVTRRIRALSEAVLGPDCFVVRGLLFDKTPDANWKVIWHQDLTIAVGEQYAQPGFGPWSEKDGVPHVQPPVSVLESMLAIRVHLDPCGPDNGPVRVIPGSHTSGRLSSAAIDAYREDPAVECVVDEGGILAFRPLLLHASAAATAPAHRRVIHLEFAATELPPPLTWKWRAA
jgi:ectoine hydroxylase-related dioxygenase (phytanoyl-CoA dioxygenase family)